MNKIDVCLSPELINQHDLKETIVVVTDVFRATSCMVAGLANGVKCIRPVLTVEECLKLQEEGYLAGGERQAQRIKGFDLDNSPFSYMEESVKGKKIAMTTTNGTLAINKTKDSAKEVLVASFSNISATAEYLNSRSKNVLIVCAGWKGRPGLEDILFAGALLDSVSSNFNHTEDSTHLAISLYLQAENNELEYLKRASHLKRLKSLSGGEDIPFCLKRDLYKVVVTLKNDELVLKSNA